MAEPNYSEIDKAFDRQCDLATGVFEVKNRQYGNAIETTGVLGASIELIGVSARLRPMVVQAPDHGRSQEEALRDILQDIHNYATIALMLMEQDNWEGK